MSLKFEVNQPPTSQEIEAERNRLKTKIKRQKIFLVTVAVTTIVTWIALYWGGFISWRELIDAVGGIALIGASVVAFAGAVVGAFAGIVALAVVLASVIILAGVDALAGFGALASVSTLAVSIVSAIIIVTVVSIEDNRESLGLLDDIHLEDCAEAVELCNKYP